MQTRPKFWAPTLAFLTPQKLEEGVAFAFNYDTSSSSFHNRDFNATPFSLFSPGAEASTSLLGAPPHVTCDVIARPCCFGIHGRCEIRTEEFCNYVKGTFHSQASLCSQVDCMQEHVCRMLPFVATAAVQDPTDEEVTTKHTFIIKFSL